MWEVAWLYNHKASKESSNITNSLNKNGMYSSKLTAFGTKKKKKNRKYSHCTEKIIFTLGFISSL